MCDKLRNGADLISDYADRNCRVVVGHWKQSATRGEFACWFLDIDGHCFDGRYYQYTDELSKLGAHLEAIRVQIERVRHWRSIA